ncbi:MAG: hypothetical protein U0787_06975 [Polyangia bacterium]
MVHRDFKPDNVMIGRDGRARVMDFGVARDVNPADFRSGADACADALGGGARFDDDGQSRLAALAVSSPLTQERHDGHAAVHVPEQFRGQASDAQRQFGYLALYEAIDGKPPFAGDNLGELAMQVFLGQVQPFSPEKKVPNWLKKVLLRGLKVQANQRYPSLQALLEDLSPERRRRRRRMLLLLSSCAALVVAGLLAGGAYRGNQALKAQRCQAVDLQLDRWCLAKPPREKGAYLRSSVPMPTSTWQRVENNLSLSF